MKVPQPLVGIFSQQLISAIADKEKIGKGKGTKFEYLVNKKSCFDKTNSIFDNLLSAILDEINENRILKL